MGKYKKEDFERVFLPGGKIQYRHRPNGEKRTELLNQARKGIITQEQMRASALKAKYLFSESQYLKAISN